MSYACIASIFLLLAATPSPDKGSGRREGDPPKTKSAFLKVRNVISFVETGILR